MLQNLYDALTEAQIVQLYKRVRPIPRWVTSRPHRRSWKWAGSPAVDHGAVSDPKLTSEGDHSVQAALEYPPLTAAYL